MQDKYVGDIGDFAKFSLLRALAPGYRLGVSWYLFPDEDEDNNDGRHIEYLCQPEKWRQFDEDTFDALGDIVKNHHRSVAEIEKRCLLPVETRFFNTKLDFAGCDRYAQAAWRNNWFENSFKYLKDSDFVFADPGQRAEKVREFSPGTPQAREKHLRIRSQEVSGWRSPDSDLPPQFKIEGRA